MLFRSVETNKSLIPRSRKPDVRSEGRREPDVVAHRVEQLSSSRGQVPQLPGPHTAQSSQAWAQRQAAKGGGHHLPRHVTGKAHQRSTYKRLPRRHPSKWGGYQDERVRALGPVCLFPSSFSVSFFRFLFFGFFFLLETIGSLPRSDSRTPHGYAQDFLDE